MRPSNAARRRRARTCALLSSFAIAGGLIAVDADAQIRTWQQPAGGNFNLAGNWAGGVPIAGQTANFSLAGPYTVTFDLSPSNATITQSAGTVTFRPDTVSSRTYTLTAGATLTGGSLTLGAPASGSNTLVLAMGSAPLDVQGGALTVGSNNDSSVGNINIGSTAPVGASNLTVTGVGSTITQSGAGITTIGSAATGGASTL